MSQDLSGVSRANLAHLREWVERGQLRLPLTALALHERGLEADTAQRLCETLAELSRAPLLAILDTILVERERVERERPRLLWTGPEARSSAALDTRVKLLELIGSARESVFWAGYRFDDASLLQPLREAMCTRKLDVTMVLEVTSNAGDRQSREQRVRAALAGFKSKVWTWREPIPRIYIDPRTTGWTRDPEHEKGGYFSQMHAKTVIVDGRISIVGSANFTNAGTTRNIEAGVWLDNREFAETLLGQWRGLIASDQLERVDELLRLLE